MASAQQYRRAELPGRGIKTILHRFADDCLDQAERGAAKQLSEAFGRNVASSGIGFTVER